MVSKEYKERANKLVKQAKAKGLVIKYKDFLKTDLAKKTALTKEETAYYISNRKGEVK